MYQLCHYATTKTANLFMEQKQIPQVFSVLENSGFCVDRCDFFAFDRNM